jgi:predicted NBD/HSP70 family sugar kinase
MWLGSDGVADKDDFVYLSISDGVGVVVGGELIRGHNQLSGEFEHVQLSMDSPMCACGATGCWMAYVSNVAAIARYQQAQGANGQPQTVAFQ